MLKKNYLLLVMISFVSCLSHDQELLKYSLEFSGKNRSELEKVLAHYKDDSLKLEAAKYLIKSMPRHYSYKQGGIMDSIKKVRENTDLYYHIDDAFVQRYSGYDYRDLPKVFDSHIITAEYLINNIDSAFFNWKNRSWNQSLSFEDFCEYLLPYRIGNEPLEEWRGLYNSKYGYFLDSIYKGDNVIEAANIISQKLTIPKFLFCDKFNLPHIGARYLFEYRYGSCKDAADLFTYVCRATGIPCVINLDPQMGHVWNAVKDSTGYDVPFWTLNAIGERGKMDINGHTKGKAYQPTYGLDMNRILVDNDELKNIPVLFKDLFLKDVSHYYFEDTLILDIPDSIERKVAFLGYFRHGKWLPFAYTNKRDNRFQFSNIESSNVYVPLIYENSTYSQIDYPFYFDKDSLHYFIPNGNKTYIAKLTRKFPIFDWMQSYINQVVNATIQGSNDPNFVDFDNLYFVKDTPTVAFNNVFINKKNKYRYLRYITNNYIYMAELHFYCDRKEISPILISGGLSQKGNTKSSLNNILDNDPLTYYISDNYGESIIFDLGESQFVDQITFMTYNDDNYIRKGDLYQLLYNNGHKWVSLGNKIADTTYLEFTVPDNALFWLRNLKRGREEQIFYIKDGKQVFPTF